RIEGGDLENPDIGHVESTRGLLDHRLRNPALLLLANPQGGDDSARLPAGRIFRNLALETCRVQFGERKARRLVFWRSETTKAHRSTSPKTMSSEPRTADTSASMCPLHM